MSDRSIERKAAWFASLSHFFTHAFMTLLPGVLVVLAGEQSLGFFALGIIVNLGYFLFGFGSIPAGVLADRLGAKRVMTLGLYGMAISSLLVGLSPESISFTVSYALLGLAASVYHPAGLSLIARHIPKKGKALSLHGILGNLGLSLAPLFAGWMVMVFDTWRAAYIVLGAVGIIFAAVVHFAKIPGEPDLVWGDLLPWKLIAASRSGSESPEERGDVRLPAPLVFLYAGSILFGFIYRGSLTYFPSLFQQELYFVSSSDQPVVLAGLVTSAVLSVGVVGQWLGGWLSDRAGRPAMVHIGIYLVVIPTAWMMSRFTDTSLIVAAAAFSLAFYGWQPIQNSLIARYTPKGRYGAGYGFNFFFIMGMGSVATAVGGYIAEDQGVDRVYLLLALTSVAALAVSIAVIAVRRFTVRFSFGVERDPADAAAKEGA